MLPGQIEVPVTHIINFTAKFDGTITYQFTIIAKDTYHISHFFSTDTSGESSKNENVVLSPGTYTRTYSFKQSYFHQSLQTARSIFDLSSSSRTPDNRAPLYVSNSGWVEIDANAEQQPSIKEWKWSQTIKVDGVSHSQPIRATGKVFVKKESKGNYKAYYLNASEWNEFCKQINLLRAAYKKQSKQFTLAAANSQMKIQYINQAIAALNEIDSSIGLQKVQANTPLSASTILKLESTFNSLVKKLK